MADPALIRSLLAAVDAAPDDVPLRVHVASLLLEADRADEALAHLSRALLADPSSAAARSLMQRALGGPAVPDPPAPAPAPGRAEDPAPPAAEEAGQPDYDWDRAERDLGPIAVPVGDEPGEPAAEVERPRVTLADVAGMEHVKDRLEVAFLGPARDARLREMYGKSLRGGLLLYGPPGCGKTFLARALAGELGAHFISVGLSDVLDMWIGNSEKNLHALFQRARRNTPCVLFLDEVDGLGGARSRATAAMRTTVQQLLSELDGVDTDNEGVFVLAATNAPWDVDAALRRPGRLDRTVLVLPPDEVAREAVLAREFRDRPTEGLDLRRAAARTEGFSGADLAHLAQTAVEEALRDSLRSGTARPVRDGDLKAALRQVRPSTHAWFDGARNVALYANSDGTYDELLAHLKQRRML
ncbi:ATP-binding protein [Kineococcus auxinigenes]|uniref:ATP-binding protein n=1 Tax=unclassified Kineococcus TaxID=2621656 RepID=UPI003D7D18AB